MSSLSVYAERLIGRVEGSASLDAGDRARGSDPLIRPFKILADQKAELESLKKASMSAVYVQKVGNKVVLEPFDAEGFEAMSRNIESLEAKIANNQSVIARLEEECSKLDLKEYSLNKLTARRTAIPKEIEVIKRLPGWDLKRVFDAAATMGDRCDAESHPRVIEARKQAEDKTRPLIEEAMALDDKIDRLESILWDFQL